jgi:hypothetical protein
MVPCQDVSRTPWRIRRDVETPRGIIDRLMLRRARDLAARRADFVYERSGGRATD